MRGLPAAVLALLAASPAGAQSDALLECASQAVTPAFRARLADAMLASGAETPASAALLEELERVSAGCADRNALAEAKRPALFSYNLARLPHDALIVRLADRGISAEVVDQALDFGPGRSNPVITGALGKPQIDALMAGLAANGTAVDKVEDATWAMIGAYAAATSLMWQELRALH